jgi:hypothetical protein
VGAQSHLGSFFASFIRSCTGLSQPVRLCSIRAIFSSSDFFSERSFAFSLQYISRSLLLRIAWLKI